MLDLVQKIFVANFLRYFIAAAPAFLLFYILFKQKWQHKKIQSRYPKRSDYIREIGYSMITVLIFAGIGYLVFGTDIRLYTQVYPNIEDYGWSWWTISIVLMILLHDTYFYWTHRAMHHPKLFRIFHLVHHKSTNPSPWAAYAFHPLEGIVEASVIFPIVFLIPFHVSALMVFLIFMIVYNVYGHLGFELLPKGFNMHPIGKWLNTSVNHNMHHKHFEGNYGLYFLFWDRKMDTLHPKYDETYTRVDNMRSITE